MPKRGPNKRVTYLVDYFDYNLFGIKLVNALIEITTSKFYFCSVKILGKEKMRKCGLSRARQAFGAVIHLTHWAFPESEA
jgi:hypothetical protein